MLIRHRGHDQSLHFGGNCHPENMLLFVFLAICCSLVTANQVNEIQPSVSSGLDFADHDCSCTKEPVPQCGCCAEFEFDKKQHQVCMNMTYVEGEKGIRFTVTYDGEVLLNETLSAKNPPPFCQGVCPFSCICEKYSNMSYGDDNKWGGCLEIYGDVLIRILDIRLGCFYLPVSQEQKKTLVNKPIESVLNYFGYSEKIFNDIQQWFQQTFGGLMSERDDKPNKQSPLSVLHKNRVEDDNEKMEVPDKE